jgi:Spy/CpxP family protein refolding chaperone
MFTVRKVVPALCLAVSMSGLAVYVASAAAGSTPPPTEGPAGHPWHGHHHGGFMMMLHKLNLTDPQKTQVKSIMAGEKSQFESLRTSSQTNREALASTPPTDTAAYAALIATAQKNAATRIQLMGETWSNIYQNVLTQTQRDAIPGIVAAAKAQREQRMEEWQAQHPSAGSTDQ